ncbi:MAG: hypothetical protein IJW62_04485, partial [Clostridia bacterium]|nr:hypothetical protein [Clostridia bacterium]
MEILPSIIARIGEFCKSFRSFCTEGMVGENGDLLIRRLRRHLLRWRRLGEAEHTASRERAALCVRTYPVGRGLAPAVQTVPTKATVVPKAPSGRELSPKATEGARDP